jgi:hypothetical protein
VAFSELTRSAIGIQDMVIVLILIAWLTIVALVVNACRAAARGDETIARSAAVGPAPDGYPTRAARLPWSDGRANAGAHQLHRVVGSTTRAGRARGEQCATGS